MKQLSYTKGGRTGAEGQALLDRGSALQFIVRTMMPVEGDWVVRLVGCWLCVHFKCGAPNFPRACCVVMLQGFFLHVWYIMMQYVAKTVVYIA